METVLVNILHMNPDQLIKMVSDKQYSLWIQRPQWSHNSLMTVKITQSLCTGSPPSWTNKRYIYSIINCNSIWPGETCCISNCPKSLFSILFFSSNLFNNPFQYLISRSTLLCSTAIHCNLVWLTQILSNKADIMLFILHSGLCC